MTEQSKDLDRLTGAFMVIGLKYGGTTGQDRQAKDKTYQLVREFVSRFNARNSSITCRDLLGCDISTPEGHDEAQKQDLFRLRCTKFVRDAVEIVNQTRT
jgi:C_GCAxxG_C_C family probable redox protein